MNNEILKQFEMFNSLDEKELETIEQISYSKKYNENEIVFFEGEDPQYFYLLVSGFVKVYKVDNKGNEIVLHNFAGATMIAEMAALEEFNFPATAVCEEQCEFILIKKNEFINLLKNNPELSFKVIKSLTRKIKNIENSLSRNLIYDSTTKVANFIYENPIIFKETKNRQIAKNLNITPETLSRVLRKFKDLNIIDKEHNLIDKNSLKTYTQV